VLLRSSIVGFFKGASHETFRGLMRFAVVGAGAGRSLIGTDQRHRAEEAIEI
jgi:hypothetical protein